VTARLAGKVAVITGAGSGIGRVAATLFGIVRYDPRRGAITSLRLVSDEATYVWYWQGKPQPRNKLLLAIENEP